MASITPDSDTLIYSREQFLESLEVSAADQIMGIQDEVFPIVAQFTNGNVQAIEHLVDIICSECVVEGGINISQQTLWEALLHARWVNFSETQPDCHNTTATIQAAENYQLIAFSGTEEIGSHSLQRGRNTLGRSRGNDIQISEESVSRKHAVIHGSAEGLNLENLNLANGTHLNNKLAIDEMLHEGDIIRMGAVRLILVRNKAQRIAGIKTSLPKTASPFAKKQPHATPKPETALIASISPEPQATVQNTIAADPLDTQHTVNISAKPARPEIKPLALQKKKLNKSTIAGFGITAAAVALILNGGWTLESPQTSAPSDSSTAALETNTLETVNFETANTSEASLADLNESEDTVNAEIPEPVPVAEFKTAKVSEKQAIVEQASKASDSMISGESLAAQMEPPLPATIPVKTKPVNTAITAVKTESFTYESEEPFSGLSGLAFAADAFQATENPPQNRNIFTNELASDDIQSILQRARQQMASTKLTRPANDNALQSYRAALRIAPNNREARAGLRKIADTYLRLAQKADSRGNVRHAKEMLRRGLSVDPTHSGLASFERQLEQPPAAPITERSPDYQSGTDDQFQPQITRAEVTRQGNTPIATTVTSAGTAEASASINHSPQPPVLAPQTIIEEPAAAKKTSLQQPLAVNLNTTPSSTSMPGDDVKLNHSVEELLLLADRQELFRQITSPPGDNAVETYRKILRISPMHPDAVTGLERIASRYFARAKLFEETEYLAEALSATEKGLAVSPNHPELTQLHNHLKWRLSGSW